MSSDVSPIRYIPPIIQRLDPKGKISDKKGDGEGNKESQERLLEKDKDTKNKDYNQTEKESASTDPGKQGDENSSQTGKKHNLGDVCGSIIDTEI
jgi:hypothetical protein